MKDKYIKFFKKELVFLMILLVVICFSFGVSYSNFIYNSNSKRAVEMFTSKLTYEMKINGVITNEINVYPGTTLVEVDIKSLNPVKSYYKIGYKSDNVGVYLYGNKYELIDEDGTAKYKLLIVNNNSYNRIVSFDITGGFTNNTINDVHVESDYTELDKTIKVGSTIEYDGNYFRVLDINTDGSINIISSNADIDISLSGANGYNNLVTEINNIIKEAFSLERIEVARSIKLEDILRYSTNEAVKYSNGSTYCKNDFLTYPKLFEYEKNSVIDYVDKKGTINPSDEYYITSPIYGTANCVSTKIINVNNIEFKESIYEDIFGEQESFLATRYNNYSNNIEWGVMSLKSDSIELNKLYDSNNNSYSANNKIRIVARLDNKINIELEDEIFKVK